MKGYSEREVFGYQHRVILHNATVLVERLKRLPDEVQEKIRCHELARAVAECLMMGDDMVKDGHYGRVEHSWITLYNDEGRPTTILDVYCMGRLPQVQLVDMDGLGSTFFHHRDLYEPGARRSDIRYDVIAQLTRTMSP